MSSQESCYSKQNAACGLLNHLRSAEGQLSQSDPSHGWKRSPPGEMVKGKTGALPAETSPEPAGKESRNPSMSSIYVGSTEPFKLWLAIGIELVDWDTRLSYNIRIFLSACHIA